MITTEQYSEGLTKLRAIQLERLRKENARLRREIALRKIKWGTTLFLRPTR